MFKFLFCVIALPVAVFGITLTPCGGGLPVPDSLRVQGCTEAPCVLANGQLVVSAVDFTPPMNSGSLLNRATILFGDLEVPINIIPDDYLDACRHLVGASCPVQAGQQYTTLLNAPVDAPVNNVDVILRFQLTNDVNVPLFCYLLPVRVIAPSE